MLKSRVAPLARVAWGKKLREQACPLMVTLWMYLFVSLTFGVLMTMFRPFSR